MAGRQAGRQAACSCNNASSVAARTKGAGEERKRIERGEGIFFLSFLFSQVMCVGSIDHYGVFLTSEPSCKGELTRSFWALQYKETVWG